MNRETEYQALLAEAPAHDSEEFLEFLRQRNVVAIEDADWLVIENFKYHTTERPWLTAFRKGNYPSMLEPDNLRMLFWKYDVLIKVPERQTVSRYHVHLINARV
jgi:hypothetical protein